MNSSNKGIPVYTLGSAEPRCYNSPSGVDIKAFIDNKPFSLIQAVSLKGHPDKLTYGEIKIIRIDTESEKQWKQFLGTERRLKVDWAEEYGQHGVLIDALVRFNNAESWEVDIETVASDLTIGFILIKRYDLDRLKGEEDAN